MLVSVACVAKRHLPGCAALQQDTQQKSAKSSVHASLHHLQCALHYAVPLHLPLTPPRREEEAQLSAL